MPRQIEANSRMFHNIPCNLISPQQTRPGFPFPKAARTFKARRKQGKCWSPLNGMLNDEGKEGTACISCKAIVGKTPKNPSISCDIIDDVASLFNHSFFPHPRFRGSLLLLLDCLASSHASRSALHLLMFHCKLNLVPRLLFPPNCHPKTLDLDSRKCRLTNVRFALKTKCLAPGDGSTKNARHITWHQQNTNTTNSFVEVSIWQSL